jgi:hypothetical protein
MFMKTPNLRRLAVFRSKVSCLSIVVALAGILASPSTARTDFLTGTGADQFAVLSQFSGNQTNFNNGTITGDVGIGSPHSFTISNASLLGNVRFSGAANASGFLGGPAPNNVSGGGSFTGSIIANDSTVTKAINAMNSLSQTLGGEAGTSTTITSGGSVNASAGKLDASGNRVFTVSSVNFANGIFTVNGGASDFVVLNIGSSANLHGQILLAGGITSDHVLFNMFGGDYTTHTGGPTLDVNTNGLATFGIFLDPNGGMSAVNTDIQGRFFGGDTVNQQIVSGANITAPPSMPSVPAPPSLVLALLGAVCVGFPSWLRRRARTAMAGV